MVGFMSEIVHTLRSLTFRERRPIHRCGLVLGRCVQREFRIILLIIERSWREP